jgi:hypothetical protein
VSPEHPVSPGAGGAEHDLHISSHAVTGPPGTPHDGALTRSITGRLLFFSMLGDVLGSGIHVLIGLVAGAVGGALYVNKAFRIPALTFLITICSLSVIVNMVMTFVEVFGLIVVLGIGITLVAAWRASSSR